MLQLYYSTIGKDIGVNVSLTQRGVNDNTELVLDKRKNKDPNRIDDTREVPNRMDETYRIGFSGYERDKETRATIGNGTVISTSGSVAEEINRDIRTSDEITYFSDTSGTNVGFESNPSSWGDLNKIMASNAGVIGNFIDDVNALTGERTDNETVFRDETFKFIRENIEKKISYFNTAASIFPTSIQEGGLLEQFARTFRKDENPIYKIEYHKDESGEMKVEITRVRKLSDIEHEGRLRVYGNGVSEALPKATANAINKTQDREYSEKYNNGEAIAVAMIHNRSRGMVSDFIESGLGKIFDGSGSSLFIPSGVSKGQAIALASRDINKEYDFVTYSQSNIIFLGSMNIFANSGLDMNGIYARSMGTPIAGTEYRRALDKVNGNFMGMVSNKGDQFGDNGIMFGAAAERDNITEENIGRVGKRSAGQVIVSNIPIIKALARSEAGTLTSGLPTVLPENEAIALYQAAPEGYLVKPGTNSVVVRPEEIKLIRNNISPYVNNDKNFSYEIVQNRLSKGNEFLDNIHRGYVFTGPTLAQQKDLLIEQYNNGNPLKLDFNQLNNMLGEIDRKMQEDYIYLLAHGKPAWEKSKFVTKAVDELAKADMERYYENNKHKYVELPNFSTSVSSAVPYARSGNESVMDINVYLDTLRKGVGLR